MIDGNLMVRLLTSLFLAFVTGLRLWKLKQAESMKTSFFRQEKTSYTPIMDTRLLPLQFGTLLLLTLFFSIRQKEIVSFNGIIGLLINVVLSVLIYYSLLFLFQKFLRKHCKPLTCAVLWTLPSVLYFTWYFFSLFPYFRSLVVRLNGSWILWLLPVWAAGFVLVLTHGIVRHLLYRRHLLKDAVPLEDAEIRKAWEDLKWEFNVRKPEKLNRLYRSSLLTTPLSVGLYRSSLCVLLPEKDYSAEETALLLRHELIHIVREDAHNKFFLLFCKALCWFNPLMWLAEKSCREDLERSCDELVLQDADEKIRKTYANLLLDCAAADSRGFTSCLSASAFSLKDRMKEALHPARRSVGIILAAVLTFLLVFSSGFVSVAFGKDKLQTVVFGNNEADPGQLGQIFLDKPDSVNLLPCRCRDPEALQEYLLKLQVYQLAADLIQIPADEPRLYVHYSKITVCIGERLLGIDTLHAPYTSTVYYLDEMTDWDYLRSLLETP